MPTDLEILAKISEKLGAPAEQSERFDDLEVIVDSDENEILYQIDQVNRITALSFGKAVRMRRFPEEMFKLRWLQRLESYSESFREIPRSIGMLENLTKISIQDTELSSVPIELSHLTRLKDLYLYHNQIVEVPREIAFMPRLVTLSLYDNPLESPPLEIAIRGIEAIRNYFVALEAETTVVREIRLIFMGDGGSGKTSLMRRLAGQDFDRHEPQTHGINIEPLRLKDANGNETVLNVWDFGGQEIMHATHQFFLSERSVYVLVVDGRREEDPDYWLQLIGAFGGQSPILVVINKIDQNPSFEVNRRHLTAKYPNIIGFYRVSCLKGDGVDAFRDSLLPAVEKVDITYTKWPRSWLDVKHEMEHLEDDFISRGRYAEICRARGVDADGAATTLVRFLRDLGVVVHFPDFRLEDTYVLEPRWITTGVYLIINSAKAAEGHGILDLRDLPGILSSARNRSGFRYPKSRHPYIVDLMLKFELCYRIDESRILLPDLLAVNEPDIDHMLAGEGLHLDLHYGFLPRSVMTQFIVNKHDRMAEGLCWRTGVVIVEPSLGSHAVIRCDYESKTISIDVFGEGRRDHLIVLRALFAAIHDRFGGIRVSERLPVPGEPGVSVDFGHLVRLEREGVTEFYPEGASRPHSVAGLLGAVEVQGAVSKADLLALVKSVIRDDDTYEVAAKKVNKIVMLEPNFMGLGVNVNELLNWIFKSRRGRRKS